MFVKAKAPATTAPTAPTAKLFCIDLVRAQLIPPAKMKETLEIANLLAKELPFSFFFYFSG